jgi:GT2 family glycosyltransferase
MINCLLTRAQFEGHRIIKIRDDSPGIGRLRNIALKYDPNPVGLRIDDDTWCEPDYIEKLLKVLIKENAGVVGGIVPYMIHEKIYAAPKVKYNECLRSFEVMDDSIFFYNTEDYFEADHLRSSYMYFNENARNIWFPTDYDEYAGFREETDFCLRMKMKGYNNFIVPSAVNWHLASPEGGTRDSWNKVGERGKIIANSIYLERMRNEQNKSINKRL